MRTKVLVLMLLLVPCLFYGGDIASYANLGFSADSRYFMFAQYGVLETSSFPYADLFIVDVPANKFVSQGVQKAVDSKESEPGFTGEAALYTVLAENVDLKKRYGIDHYETGRLLYLLLDGEKPKEELDFRDFVVGTRYKVKLVQSSSGEKESVRSSFYIDLTVTPQSGTSSYYRVGLPNYRRDGVKGYRIKQVLLSPNGKSLVFLIEKEEVDKTGSNIRFMVETVSIA